MRISYKLSSVMHDMHPNNYMQERKQHNEMHDLFPFMLNETLKINKTKTKSKSLGKISPFYCNGGCMDFSRLVASISFLK